MITDCPRCDRPWSEHRDTKWRQMKNGNWFLGPGAMVYGSILVERRDDGTFAWKWSDTANDYEACMSASYTVAEGEAATLDEAKRAAEAACGEWCPGPAVDWRARALAAEALLTEWGSKDGNSPGYNRQKAETYGRIAAEERALLREARDWKRLPDMLGPAISHTNACVGGVGEDVTGENGPCLRCRIDAALRDR